MIRKMQSIQTLDNFILQVTFDEGTVVLYDVKQDMGEIESYRQLEDVYGLFNQAKLDSSRTVVVWNSEIDLPSDTIYEYGIKQ